MFWRCFKYLFILFCFSSVGILSAQGQSNKHTDACTVGFNIRLHNNRYFAEIPDSLLGRYFLIVSRLSKSAVGVNRILGSPYGGLAGDKIGSGVISFEKTVPGKILLKQISFSDRCTDSSENGLYHSFTNSNNQGIYACFANLASTVNAHTSIIDITELLTGDNSLLFFDEISRNGLKIQAFQPGQSAVTSIFNFPKRIRIESLKTFSFSRPDPVFITVNKSGFVSFGISTTLLLLPKEPMRPRYADNRVDYFTVTVKDYDINPQAIEARKMITRWRLEPNERDLEKYKRGELVEPKKPIVFYIDPATPKKWVPYLIRAVDNWQPAFEQAGFKNAIYARPAPTALEDPGWSLADAGYSTIVYQATEERDASYSTIVDPRSGEIVESHIKLFHGLQSMVRDQYLIQASPSDPGARRMIFDDSLMGSLISYEVSHEVGHALGFPHNWGASTAIPVENLRDKKWVEMNGYTPSIMDYSRFNYVAQPEDSVRGKGLLPRIGNYDKWAIEWGYRFLDPGTTQAAEADSLNRWILQKAGIRELWSGGERDGDDPRVQTEDIGDDAMKGSAYGIKNLQFVLSHLPEWTSAKGKDYSELAGLYQQLLLQFETYMFHVARNIAGIYGTPKTTDQAGNIYVDVPKDIQENAVDFLNAQLFRTPEWLIDTFVARRTNLNPAELVSKRQTDLLSNLISVQTFKKLALAELRSGEKVFTISNLLNDLRRGIWGELYANTVTTIYRQNLQRTYILDLVAMLEPAADEFTGYVISQAVKVELKSLKVGIDNKISACKEKIEKSHFLTMSELVSQ